RRVPAPLAGGHVMGFGDSPVYHRKPLIMRHVQGDFRQRDGCPYQIPRRISTLDQVQKRADSGVVSLTPDYAQKLRAAGLRVTRPRLAVLEAVYGNPHADTETIVGAVRQLLPDVSRQAVYDVLAAFTS